MFFETKMADGCDWTESWVRWVSCLCAVGCLPPLMHEGFSTAVIIGFFFPCYIAPSPLGCWVPEGTSKNELGQNEEMDAEYQA